MTSVEKKSQQQPPKQKQHVSAYQRIFIARALKKCQVVSILRTYCVNIRVTVSTRLNEWRENTRCRRLITCWHVAYNTALNCW